VGWGGAAGGGARGIAVVGRGRWWQGTPSRLIHGWGRCRCSGGEGRGGATVELGAWLRWGVGRGATTVGQGRQAAGSAG